MSQLGELIFTIFHPLVSKVLALFTSAFFLQASSVQEGFGRLFEVSIALGILAVVTWVIFREYQKESEYGREQDQEIKQLLTDVTEALNNSSRALKESSKAVRKNSNILDRVMDKMERIERKALSDE